MKIILTLLISLFYTLPVFSKVKIHKIDFVKKSSHGEIIIGIKGKMDFTPDLLIKGNIVQVSVPKSFVWPKIDKRVEINKAYDTNLMAYQFDKDIVRVRAVLPYSIKGNEDKVSLMLEDNKIILNFPVIVPKKAFVKKKALTKNRKRTVKANYDEKYLEALLADGNTKVKPTHKKIVEKKDMDVKVDEVKNIASSVVKTTKSNNPKFSIWGYVLKFLAFLGVVLVGFYAVVYLMRKGVMKKGRLGFFNSSNLVEVLSTTHIGPKKSLLLVKAHKQVFLVSSTEKGMEFLSEINDVSGLIKNEEKSTLGTNFDVSLNAEESTQKNFKLKEDLENSGGVDDSYRKGETPKKENSKYSDQIKSKLKNLKPLQ